MGLLLHNKDVSRPSGAADYPNSVSATHCFQAEVNT
jgi:hypothetical protein